jgi:hypothetical protein
LKHILKMDSALPWNDTAGSRQATRLYRIPLTAEEMRSVDINTMSLIMNPFEG